MHTFNQSSTDPLLDLNCDQCGKLFTDSSILKNHIRGHKKPHICTVCNKKFPRPYQLRRHVEIKQVLPSENAFNHPLTFPLSNLHCGRCKKLFTDSKTLKKHIRGHKMDHVCTVCDKKFQRPYQLRSHMEIKHGAPSAPVACSICGQIFINAIVLKEHKRNRHLLSHVCVVCDKKLSNQFKLKEHLFTHGNAQDRKCLQCGQIFTRLRILKEHMKYVHKSSLEYSQASMSFIDKNMLEQLSHSQHKTTVASLTTLSVLDLEQHKFSENKTTLGDRATSPVLNLSCPSHKTPHVCTICDKNCQRPGQLQSHMETKHGAPSEPAVCSVCGQIFINAIVLKQHQRNRHFLSHICLVCDKKFSNGFKLKEHMFTHGSAEDRTCLKCGETFRRLRILKEHMKEMHGSGVECSLCNMSCVDKNMFKQHMISQHDQQETSIADLKPYICNVCEKCFAKRTNFKMHMRVHMGDRRYICTICGKACSQVSGLADHMRTHTGERKHVCNVCGKEFGRATRLKYHQRCHTGERPLTCDVCNKSFADPNRLYGHRKIHSDEKLYNCVNCTARFNCKSALNRHMRIHSDIRKYTCPLCENQFNQAGNLKTHMRIHTRDQPYKCNDCDKSFSYSGSLKKHQETHQTHQIDLTHEIEKPVDYFSNFH